MDKILFLALFVLGSLFLNASHIPAWLLGGKRPTHRNWKIYGIVGMTIYVLIFVLANTFYD